MTVVFADTLYWVAIARPGDAWAVPARAARSRLGQSLLVTTDEVLAEFLTGMCDGGPGVRRIAARMVREILDDPGVRVLEQTRHGFQAGLQRFERREDKSYSLTDCISMNVMESQGIHAVLTNDHHFEQEGFSVLIQ